MRQFNLFGTLRASMAVLSFPRMVRWLGGICLPSLTTTRWGKSPRLNRLHESLAVHGDAPESCILHFNEHRLYARKMTQGFLCLIVAPGSNMPALKMAVNLVIRRIGQQVGQQLGAGAASGFGQPAQSRRTPMVPSPVSGQSAAGTFPPNVDPNSLVHTPGPAHTPAPMHTPGPGGSQVPGQVPGQPSGQTPRQVPGQVPGQTPGQPPAPAPQRMLRRKRPVRMYRGSKS